MLVALEVDLADLLAMTATNTAGSHASVGIPTPRLFLDLHQALLGPGLRNVVVRRDGNVSRRRR